MVYGFVRAHQCAHRIILDDPEPDELNVRNGGAISTTGRALMLGLKSNRSYTYHVVAQSGETVFISNDHSLVTPAAPDLPLVTTTWGDYSARTTAL